MALAVLKTTHSYKQFLPPYEHDVYACVSVGNLLHDLQRFAGNEEMEREAAQRNLDAEQTDRLLRLADVYRANRARDISHSLSLSIAKRTLVFRQLCDALGDRVLGVAS